MALQKINLLSEKIKIAGITSETVKQVVQNKKIRDFEDGMQYYSAVQAKCKCIITQDKDDFYFSEIEVLNAQSFLEKAFA